MSYSLSKCYFLGLLTEVIDEIMRGVASPQPRRRTGPLCCHLGEALRTGLGCVSWCDAGGQANFNNFVSQGYWPVNISAVNVGGTRFFTALYDKAAAGVARNGTTSPDSPTPRLGPANRRINHRFGHLPCPRRDPAPGGPFHRDRLAGLDSRRRALASRGAQLRRIGGDEARNRRPLRLCARRLWPTARVSLWVGHVSVDCQRHNGLASRRLQHLSRRNCFPQPVS